MTDELSEISNSIETVLDAFGTVPFSSTERALSAIRLSLDLDHQSHAPLNQHLTCWTLIQSAALREATSQLVVARSSLIEIREGIASNGFHNSDHGLDCYCVEWSTASLLLARVSSSSGNLYSSIGLLDELRFDIENFPYHGDLSILSEIDSHRNFCSELLGHDERVPARLHQSRIEGASEGHWWPSTPLYGRRYERFKDQYSKLRTSYEEYGGEVSDLKFEALIDLIEHVRAWTREFPSATLPQRLLIIYSLWVAKYQIAKDMLEEFEQSTEFVQIQLEELTAQPIENQLDVLLIVQNLIPLATEISYHEFDSEALRAKYFPVGYGCILTCEALLDELTDIFPISSALALTMSLFSDTASSIYEIVGRYSEAIDEMNKSVAIIDELITRDPLNERALRIKALYDKALRSASIESVQEVKSWNWLINDASE
jgi:hypothetical protein